MYSLTLLFSISCSFVKREQSEIYVSVSSDSQISDCSNRHRLEPKVQHFYDFEPTWSRNVSPALKPFFPGNFRPLLNLHWEGTWISTFSETTCLQKLWSYVVSAKTERSKVYVI